MRQLAKETHGFVALFFCCNNERLILYNVVTIIIISDSKK